MNVFKSLKMDDKQSISLKKQAALFASLSELIRNGFSLMESLNFMETTTPIDAKLIRKIREQLDAGQNLSASMRFFLTSDLYQQLRIADEHGDVISGMLDISRFIQLTMKQRQKIKALVTYPLILVGLLVMMVVIIKLVIMPQTSSLLPNQTPQGTSFPWWWVGGMILVLGVGLLFFLFKRVTGIRRAELLVKLPLVGRLFRNYYAYYVANNLALMFKNGLDLHQIILVFHQFETKSLLWEMGERVEQSIQRGYGLQAGLAQYHFIAPEMVTFLENGSEQEQVSQNLLALSELYFQRLMQSSDTLIKLIQPLSFLAIGALIFITYLQMLMPMYEAMKGIY
ncbi:type II secretion system F family protein [Fructilactobacillus hinvesii]|uniref:Type II secretion system F family protein n=1 Tax=Fructilactobacillus hinvesii TaxID=2940300 RepID=A0ABY5BT62_9LACO|nr:type II secretion system F family protein [Fructilactobacillus hinvesii]USS87648.1 type II secretion system F family protein [Fructilactobacillus hinvesii]